MSDQPQRTFAELQAFGPDENDVFVSKAAKIIDILRADRDEWKRQHDNLLNVRQQDIAVLSDRIAALELEKAELVEALQKVEECLRDMVSHHHDFHLACRTTRDTHLRSGDRDSASYWDYQVDVLARMKVQASAWLDAINSPSATSTPDQSADHAQKKG